MVRVDTADNEEQKVLNFESTSVLFITAIIVMWKRDRTKKKIGLQNSNLPMM